MRLRMRHFTGVAIAATLAACGTPSVQTATTSTAAATNPPPVGIEMGDRVVCGEKQYIVRRAAPFYAGEEIVYYWAILHPEEAGT